ncbi:MAG: SHOCT domain-containing protein [Ectothiorhodospiraceae bacterium]|nr:SHOCT domain-containing protein [Ectothiorhodospiraceae bacterium]
MKHRMIALIAFPATAPMASPALAQRYEDYHGFWHPASGWGHMLFGGLMMIIFWGGVIALIVLLIHWLGGPGDSRSHKERAPDALDILKQRYARGEIDREEYQQRKQDLAE